MWASIPSVGRQRATVDPLFVERPYEASHDLTGAGMPSIPSSLPLPPPENRRCRRSPVISQSIAKKVHSLRAFSTLGSTA